MINNFIFVDTKMQQEQSLFITLM